MNKSIAVNNSSFAYSLNMLKLLLKMQLINEEEYNKIIAVSAKYYGVKNYCV